MANLQEGVVQYINCELMQKELEEILNEELNSYSEDYPYLRDLVNVEEYAEYLVLSFNSDMGKYLNSSEHHISGNFNNIDYDYPDFLEGDGPHYNKKLVDDMVNRLNNNDDSELSRKDRDFLVDWFFETFGTFGITYKFNDYLGEIIYANEEEEICV
jgi:hypothetical protein